MDSTTSDSSSPASEANTPAPSSATVRRARTVLERGDPDLVQAVLDGEVTVYRAAGVVRELDPEGQRRWLAARRERARGWAQLVVQAAQLILPLTQRGGA